MKNLWKILTFLFLFTLTACMPDSLTKFKEAPTKKAEAPTSSGGSGAPTPPSTCNVGVAPECTSPGGLTYPVNVSENLIAENGDDPSQIVVGSVFPSKIPGQDDYISVTANEADFSAKSGFIVNPNGDLESEGPLFLPKTTFTFNGVYSTPELASDELSSATVTFTQATDLESISIPTRVGQQLIIRLDDVTFFTTASGFNYISSPTGAVGQVSYIDKANKELHVTIITNSGSGTFIKEDDVDNNTTFFTSRAKVENVYYAYDRSSDIQTKSGPIVKAFQTLSTEEAQSLTYSIFPSLPAGLSFNESDGTIGTLRAYQYIDDGTFTTVAGSRTITGNASSLFLSQFQVGSSITINGELHKIYSIISSSEMETYLPATSSATVANVKKHISGSVELTNGSATITGHATSFSSEVVPTKRLEIDSVGTFVGYAASYVTIDNDQQLTMRVLPSVVAATSPFGGTALTVPELKAAKFIITAKNILNKSVSTQIEIGLLGTVLPKSISSIVYPTNVGSNLVLPVGNVSSFTVGGYVSNEHSGIAKVDFIDVSENKLFLTLSQLGKICTDITYTTSATCTAAGESWIDRNFESGDNVDNSPSFFSAQTTVTSDLTRVYPVSSTPVTITPFIVPTTLSAPELASLVYSISPDISSGQGFCSNTTYSSEFDCDTDPLDLDFAPGSSFSWTQGLSFNTANGVISGTLNQAISETTFTISVENLVGRVTTSEVTISANQAPTGLAVARNVLLHVPSNSAFEIGDAISTNNGAIGTVTGKFRINATNTERGIFQFEYLEVRVESGTFQDFDDLDNIPLFASQKTYILGLGVYTYNTKVSVTTNTNSLKDPEYTNYVSHESKLQIGGSDRANVVFNDEVNDNLYLLAFDKNTYAANIEPSYITTGDVLTAVNVTGTPSVTVSQVEANNLKLQTDSVPTGLVSNFSKGHDITSTGSAGIGMLHDFTTSGGNFSYVSVTEGVFSTGADIEAASPFAASTATITATGVSAENAFYFYRNVKGTVEIQLYDLNDSIVIELDKALPAGLETVVENGNIVRIEGIPTGPSTKEKFTLTATNAYGSTKVEFFIKVYDQFMLVDTTGSLTSILHKTGKGNGRKPCSVTEEQMLYGDLAVKDISCFLDVGEDELKWNGIKMQMQMGENLCQLVEETPAAFWHFSGGNSSTDLGVAIYDHSGFEDCTSGAPLTRYTTDANGTLAMSAIANPKLLITAAEPLDLCMYNYNTQYADSDLPMCDNATLPYFTRTWNPTEFECQTGGGLVTSDESVLDCENNNGTCAGGLATGAEANRGDCEAADPGTSVWTPTSQHNDGGGLLPALGTCVGNTVVAESGIECSGEQRNCIAGARRSSPTFSDQDIVDGVTTMVHNMTAQDPLPTKIDFDYKTDYEPTDYKTNLWFSNYYNACNADLYKPDTESQQASMDLTSPTANYLGSGSQSTYQYVCKSGAGTIKARIRMIVRDFDRDFKVKLGYCANSTYTNRADCEDPSLGNTTWTASGIDYYNPDTVAGAPGSGDSRHVLRNTQLDGFNDSYNRYDNHQSFIGGGYTCGAGANAANTANFGTLDPTFPEIDL
jgi:hypothetical protein